MRVSQPRSPIQVTLRQMNAVGTQRLSQPGIGPNQKDQLLFATPRRQTLSNLDGVSAAKPPQDNTRSGRQPLSLLPGVRRALGVCQEQQRWEPSRAGVGLGPRGP